MPVVAVVAVVVAAVPALVAIAALPVLGMLGDAVLQNLVDIFYHTFDSLCSVVPVVLFSAAAVVVAAGVNQFSLGQDKAWLVCLW